MRLLWYPEEKEGSVGSSTLNNLRKELGNRKDLLLRVEVFLGNLLHLRDLQCLYKSEQTAQLGDGLHEMRIPKSLRGGVVRIYFCYARNELQTLVLLEAEFKQDKKAKKISAARKQYKLYLEKLKRREK